MPTRIDVIVPTLAVARIPIGAAPAAEAPAVRPAEADLRYGQHNRLPHVLVQVDQSAALVDDGRIRVLVLVTGVPQDHQFKGDGKT